MNYIHQINSFWSKYGAHEELSPVSIAVYFALLHLNNISGWKSKIKVHPREVMDLVMIGSTKTLYHHLQKLHQLGLIQYEPGKNQYQHTYMVLPRLYDGKDLPQQKLHNQSNTKETPTIRHSSQTTDNQRGYEAPKLVNKETSKHIKTKTFFLNDLESILFSSYEKFIKRRTGLPPIVNNSDSLSLKKIAEYLNKSEAGSPASIWDEMLSNWERLNPFYQSKISLEQIQKNLLSIFDQIRNYDRNHKSNHSKNDCGERSLAKRKDFKF